MDSTFYLPRELTSNDQSFTETELLDVSSYVVILAEPGGGKTELMRSFARKLNTTAVSANNFAYSIKNQINAPLVIDAFDELSKVDPSGIYKLLNQARALNPTCVYLSSRSSEWYEGATNAFRECIGHVPLVVRLCEFTEAEQRSIFEHHVPGEDFVAFRSEVARFDLDVLLPNPQFLKLLADAFIESGRVFTDKRSIFAQAVDRLAKEANSNLARSHLGLSTTQKVSIASEVFSKLLLSGAEGVCTSEARDDRIYPFLPSLCRDAVDAVSILATRLFKPGESEDKHSPVHKIVAEYCAAHYLTKRIVDPSDHLTLGKCLAVIAPNSTVRDELRGLLGWMAALGDKDIEETAIRLDPYAVLANGDPSQIERSSKRLLLESLKDIEAKDPFFRREDFQRRFSIAGFFTHDVVEEIRHFLTNGNEGHLRDLILELLQGSPAVLQLRHELRQLVLSPGNQEFSRRLANRCLLGIDGQDYTEDLNILLAEATSSSLRIAAETFETLGPETFEIIQVAGFFRACVNLYPDQRNRHDHLIGGRYLVKRLIARLDLATIEDLLNDLTQNLVCVCGKIYYECYCRNGRSKVVGSLLDRYFELATPPYEAQKIWQWVENLIFHQRKSMDQSNAVKVLQTESRLRKDVLAHVFGELSDSDQIFQTRLGRLWKTEPFHGTMAL